MTPEDLSTTLFVLDNVDQDQTCFTGSDNQYDQRSKNMQSGLRYLLCTTLPSLNPFPNDKFYTLPN